MDKETAQQLALAIAKANGHPNAQEWADMVAAHFAGEATARPPLMTAEEVAAALPPADVGAANVDAVPAGAGMIESGASAT